MKSKYYIEKNIKDSSVTKLHFWNTRINDNTALVELECGSISEAMSCAMTSIEDIPDGTIIYRASEESSFFLEPLLKVDKSISAFTLTPLPPKNELYVLLYSISDTGFSYIGSESKMEFWVGMRLDKLKKENLYNAYNNHCFQNDYAEGLDAFKELAKSKSMLFDYYGTRLI